jgi:hypothetical protein
MKEHDCTATIDTIGEGWTDPAATVDRWNEFIAPVIAEATTDAMRDAGDEPLVSAVPGRAQLASEWAWEQFCAGEAGEDDGAAAELAEGLRDRLAPSTPAAIVNDHGQVVFSAVVPEGIGEVSVAGAVTTEGAPVNVRSYWVSRSKRNLGTAADGWNVPQLTARSYQGEAFYLEVQP